MSCLILGGKGTQMIERILAVAVMVCGIAGGPVLADANRTAELKLPNGLTVLLRPIPGAQQIAVLTLLAIGNDDDPAGKCGLAHLVEHLYSLAATGSTPARTFEAFARAHPLGWNAQTGDDYTLFATICPPADMPAELADVAARLSGLRVTQDQLQREKGRMLAELGNMYANVPSLAAQNLARQQIRPGPEGTRRGGLPEQVRTITLDDANDRIEAYYRPCNVVIVLAGGFDQAGVSALVERLLGSLPAGQPAPPPQALRPPVLGGRLAVTAPPAAKSRSTSVCLALPAPEPSDPSYPALLVLVMRLMLSAGMTGAAQDQVRFAALDDAAMLSLAGEASGPQQAAEMSQRFQTLLAQACAQPLDPQEIQAAINGLGAMPGGRPRFGMGNESLWPGALRGTLLPDARRRTQAARGDRATEPRELPRGSPAVTRSGSLRGSSRRAGRRGCPSRTIVSVMAWAGRHR